MSVVSTKLKMMARSPVACITFIIGLSAVVGGLYVLSPYLVVDVSLAGAPSLVQNLASQAGIFTLGAVAILNGLVITYGAYNRNYRVASIGLFINILLRLYVIIATILAQGFFPLTWLSSATIMFISVVCYLYVRTKMHSLEISSG